MRTNAEFFHALRSPLVLPLHALWGRVFQNQLRLSAMADMGARRDLATAARRLAWRPQRSVGAYLLVAGIAAAGILAIAAILAGGIGEVAMLALLGALAALGAFLVLALVSVYLRVSERAAAAEMVKTM